MYTRLQNRALATTLLALTAVSATGHAANKKAPESAWDLAVSARQTLEQIPAGERKRTDYTLVMDAYRHIAELRFKEQFYPALLSYHFASFANSFGKNPPKLPAFSEWLQPWLRLAMQGERAKDAPYSLELAADVTLAFKLGILSQRALTALRPDKLRKSGAFPKENT